jgi:hypothetical protein
MLGRFSTTAVWALLGLTACGMTRVGSTGTDTTGDAEPGPVRADRLCPSAGWDPGALVAAGFDGDRFVGFDGSGARRVLHASAVPSGAERRLGGHVIVERNRMTAVAAWSFEGSDGGSVGRSGESLRFDASGNRIWRLEGSVIAPSDTGAIATIDGSELLARADGTFSPLPAPLAEWTRRSFMTAPDAEGWLMALGSTADTPPGKVSKLALVNLDGKRVVELPMPSTGVRDVRSLGGKHLYLAAQATWTLEFASPDGVHSVDLGIPLEHPSPSLAVAGSWAVVVAGDKPVLRVDVEAEQVFPIESTAIDAALAARVGYGPLQTISSEQWVLGSVDDDPVWLVDAATGTVSTIALERLSPLRRLDGAYCNNASFPVQGLIGLGLRDESLAGFYVGRSDGAGWTRIGRPYRDVQGIVGRRVANTWILDSSSGKGTYCPGFRPFDPSPTDDAIVGDAIQIVPPNAPPLVFQNDPLWSSYSFTLDPTGMCAYREPRTGEETEPVVLDLGTAKSVTVNDVSDFVWLSD